MGLNKIAYLIAGAALGAAGAALIKEGKADNLLQSLVQGGHGLTEKILGAAEKIKEDVEDYLAEAKFMHEENAKKEAAAEKRAKGIAKVPAKKTAPKTASATLKTAKKNASAKAKPKKATPQKKTK